MVTIKQILEDYEKHHPNHNGFIDLAALIKQRISSGGDNNGASEQSSIDSKK
jgi:hypothetical protein